jgi:hypothetical protein
MVQRRGGKFREINSNGRIGKKVHLPHLQDSARITAAKESDLNRKVFFR